MRPYSIRYYTSCFFNSDFIKFEKWIHPFLLQKFREIARQVLLGHVSYLWHVLIWPNSPLNPWKNFSKGLPRRIETSHPHIHCWPRVTDRLVLVYRPLWQLLKIIILLFFKIIFVLKLWILHEFKNKKMMRTNWFWFISKEVHFHEFLWMLRRGHFSV